MKNKVVIFDTDGYARIFINPSKDIMSLPSALINPDLNKVKDVAPEYWKLEDGAIVPMTIHEMYERDKDLTKEIVNPNIVILEKKEIIKSVPKWVYTLIGFEAVIIAGLLLIK